MKMEKTQDLPKIYEENSCFYTFTYESFVDSGRRVGLNPHFQEVDFVESIDIDTEEDWDFCMKMIKYIGEK
jgi:CMP-N-acetylneuraminic acid synthetase